MSSAFSDSEMYQMQSDLRETMIGLERAQRSLRAQELANEELRAAIGVLQLKLEGKYFESDEEDTQPGVAPSVSIAEVDDAPEETNHLFPTYRD